MAYYNNDILYNDNQIYNTIININQNHNFNGLLNGNGGGVNDGFSRQEIQDAVREHANDIIREIRRNCIEYYGQNPNIQTLDELIDQIILNFPMIQADNISHFRNLLREDERRLSETQQMFIVHQIRVRFLENYLLDQCLNELQIILNIKNDLERETNI